VPKAATICDEPLDDHGGTMTQPNDPFQKQPPEQGGYPSAPPPDQGGYPAAPSQGGYPAAPPPDQGGYPAAPSQGGYPPPPQPGQGAYPPPPQPGQGGYPPQGYSPAPPPTQGYGGYAPAGTYFDPASGLNLPNGTRLAAPGRRVGTYFLEILLFIVTLAIGYLVWMFIAWTKGQSPGKQLMHMRVYKPVDGRIATFGTMALRQIVGGIVEGLVFPVIQIVSLIMMITGKEHKAIHDYIANTTVLDDPNEVLRPA
jgi:uncharacterized RDD family membrane protein YckC